jgi:hypothetical protein
MASQKKQTDNWSIFINLVLVAYILCLFYFTILDKYMGDAHSELSEEAAEARSFLLGYIFVQNVLLLIVFSLTMRRKNTCLKNVNRALWFQLFVSSVLGIYWYIYPVYIKAPPKDQAEKSTLYKVLQKDHHLSLFLLLSVLVPFAVIFLFVFTIVIVICVYVKEHFKLSRLLGGQKTERYDYDNENEMLRKHFNSSDDIESDEDNRENERERKQVLNFYLGMMKREVHQPATKEPRSEHYLHDSDDDKLAMENGQYCYPLCEKRFKTGDELRRIFPCDHVFHERCIKIWLYKGEHQFCPYCRGNIMKEKASSPEQQEARGNEMGAESRKNFT